MQQSNKIFHMEQLTRKSTFRAIPLLTMIIIISMHSWVRNIATPAWQIFLVYGILILLNVAVIFQKYKTDKVGMKPMLLALVFFFAATAAIFIYQFNS
jgi:hypothetical protein